jgi:hypothetical protein
MRRAVMDVGKLEASYIHSLWNYKDTAIVEKSLISTQKINTALPYGPEIVLLDIYLRELTTYVHKHVKFLH